MITYTMKQSSADWYTVKRGIPSASAFHRIVKSDGSPSSARTGYIKQLIGEILGEQEYSPTAFSDRGLMRPHTAAMAHGKNTEPAARQFYALEKNCYVKQVGFVTTDDHRFGCSPDGLIGANGGLELKCPQEKAHFQYLGKGELPVRYKAQVHGQIIVCELDWVDFMSYSAGHDPLIIRVVPDEFTDMLACELFSFLRLYDEALDYRTGMTFYEAIAEVRRGETFETLKVA